MYVIDLLQGRKGILYIPALCKLQRGVRVTPVGFLGWKRPGDWCPGQQEGDVYQ